jgi:hypothetical protein
MDTVKTHQHPVIKRAHIVGARLPAWEPGSEIWECWADRIDWAYSLWLVDHSDPRIRDVVQEANRYAG